MEAFVVRIWTPDYTVDQETLRGVAEHVRTGERTTFARSSDLLAFLQATMSPQPAAESQDFSRCARAPGEQRSDEIGDGTDGQTPR